MAEFGKISEAEFQIFSREQALGNFLQTTAMGHLRQDRGWQSEYVALKKDGAILAAALLSSTKIRFGRYYEINGGPLLDFHDATLLAEFFQGVKNYVKQQGGLYLTIVPNFVYQKRDDMGTPIAPAETKVFQQLQQLGFKHHGFTVGNHNETPRWMFVKDLAGMDEQALWASYSKSAQYSIKKTKEFGITLRQLTYEELPLFKEITEHTSERRAFQDKDLAYYQSLFQEFGDQARFMVAEIDFDTYIANLETKKQALAERLADIDADLAKNPNSRKRRNQKREFEDERQTFVKRIAEAKELRTGPGPVVLAGSLFILQPQEVVYLFSGSYDQYKKFYAPYLLQDDIMRTAVAAGISKYNFYGVSGEFDGHDGVLKFKQSFSGYTEEMIGTFDLIVQPLKYQIYQALRGLVDKVRG